MDSTVKERRHQQQQQHPEQHQQQQHLHLYPRWQQRRYSLTKTWAQRLAPLRNYLWESNVHGYKNLAEPNRIHLERFIWLMIISGFIAGAIYSTASTLADFYAAPTAISELPIRRSVKEISFPAVAICSPIRFSRWRLENLTDFV